MGKGRIKFNRQNKISSISFRCYWVNKSRNRSSNEWSNENYIDSLAENERVELRGFGTFGVKHRMPKKARNPGTGDAIYLPERYVPTFKPSKIMRSRVNELTKK